MYIRSRVRAAGRTLMTRAFGRYLDDRRARGRNSAHCIHSRELTSAPRPGLGKWLDGPALSKQE